MKRVTIEAFAGQRGTNFWSSAAAHVKPSLRILGVLDCVRPLDAQAFKSVIKVLLTGFLTALLIKLAFYWHLKRMEGTAT